MLNLYVPLDMNRVFLPWNPRPLYMCVPVTLHMTHVQCYHTSLEVCVFNYVMLTVCLYMWTHLCVCIWPPSPGNGDLFTTIATSDTPIPLLPWPGDLKWCLWSIASSQAFWETACKDVERGSKWQSERVNGGVRETQRVNGRERERHRGTES